MNLGLHEIDRAEHHLSDDLHEWTLVQYIKGRLFMDLPATADYHEKSIQAFEAIWEARDRLNSYYHRMRPFFAKWFWPNFYYFSGIAHVRAGCHVRALAFLERGRTCSMLPPYHDRLSEGIRAARAGIDQYNRKGEA